MIATVMLIQVRRLLHNRVELLLTFVVPIAFFSIFALIFGGGLGSGTTPKIKVVAIDELGTAESGQVIAMLRDNASLRFMREPDDSGKLDRKSAAEIVRNGTATMAIVVCNKADSIGDQAVGADLLADSSDQVAAQVVSAMVARSLMLSGTGFGPPLTDPESIASVPAPAATVPVTTRRPVIDESADSPSSIDEPDGSTYVPLPAVSDPSGVVEVIDVMGEGKSNPVVSMYAAGIAVMFLLFGATGGGGVLLEERENETLDRLLSTRLSMDQMLLGKWFYMTCLGVLQVGVMFLWAQVVFGVDLVGHLDGFFIMTAVTAAAASGFGLFLATLCRSRGQLNGLSVILVLTMSALGGSMVPRYLMSDRLKEAGLWTFNAWALDGYDKIFWRDLPVASLGPQLSVLLACGFVFLLLARMLAVRWESE